MKSLITFLSTWLLCTVAFAQSTSLTASGNETEAARVQAWLNNIYEPGVKVVGDSFTITKEARMVATDSAMRSIIYPEVYAWQDAQYLLKNMQIKMGLWYLVNLYPQSDANKQAVLQYVLSLEKTFDMEKALIGSFYTYIFFDPQAGSIDNGKPVIMRPDILESKLAVVKEIAGYIRAQREKL